MPAHAPASPPQGKAPAHHPNPRLIALVAAGGMLGTGARYLLTASVPVGNGWPTATFVENLLGALLLGALLEALVRRGPETANQRWVRLALGTGVLGGFTTFSSLALELQRLLDDGSVLLAAAYATLSLCGGLSACLLGVVLAAKHHQWRHPRLPRDPDATDTDTDLDTGTGTGNVGASGAAEAGAAGAPQGRGTA